MKKLILISGSLLLFLILLFFAAGPFISEKALNSVHKTRFRQPSEKAKALANKIFIADLHSDALMWKRDLLKKSSLGHVDVPRLIEGNVGLQTFAVVSQIPVTLNNYRNSSENDILTFLEIAQLWPVRTWISIKERALYQSEKLHQFAKKSNGKMIIIKSVSDLDAYISLREKNPHITAGLLAIEGSQVLEGNLDNINVMYNAGFRMMSPNHFFDTFVSGSAHGIDKGGLTEKGREMVRIMNSRKMIIDLTHTSPKAIDDILKLTTRPVLVSHTGVKGVCDNIRNLSDAHIDGVVKTGGIIGITYFPFAMCGEDISNIVRSIRYTVRRAGIKHVALGSDYDGAVAVPFDTASIVILADALINDGFTNEEIGLIMGGNVLRFLRENLPE